MEPSRSPLAPVALVGVACAVAYASRHGGPAYATGRADRSTRPSLVRARDDSESVHPEPWDGPEQASVREQAEAAGIELPRSGAEDIKMGKPEEQITARFDVVDQIDAKRASMRAHASQIAEHSWFLAIPDEGFGYAFGVEWAIRDGQGPGITETDPMAGLPA